MTLCCFCRTTVRSFRASSRCLIHLHHKQDYGSLYQLQHNHWVLDIPTLKTVVWYDPTCGYNNNKYLAWVHHHHHTRCNPTIPWMSTLLNKIHHLTLVNSLLINRMAKSLHIRPRWCSKILANRACSRDFKVPMVEMWEFHREHSFLNRVWCNRMFMAMEIISINGLVLEYNSAYLILDKILRLCGQTLSTVFPTTCVQVRSTKKRSAIKFRR